MAVSMELLLVVLNGFCITTLQAQTALDISQVDINHKGEVMKSHRSLIRHHDADSDVTLAELSEVSASKQDPTPYHGVADATDRAAKVAAGTAHSDKDASKAKAAADTAHSGKDATQIDALFTAPSVAGIPQKAEMAEYVCEAKVGKDMGLSDYGRIDHGCSSCAANCTSANRQQPTKMGWTIEPPLSDCNAKDMSFYVHLENIDKLHCDHCEGKGIAHKLEFEMGSNAVAGGSDQTALSFKGWMGPEIMGKTSEDNGLVTSFTGKHVVEVADTLVPLHSSNCNDANAAGHWYAIPGQWHGKSGESFVCERICKEDSCHANTCNRKSHVRCEASMAMEKDQLFSYRVHEISVSTTGTYDGNNYVGPEWEITAQEMKHDSSTPGPIMVIGRVILVGNDPIYGIKSVSQTHQHIGCVPCDLFYEATIVTGPFIHDPPNVHKVISADGTPPDLTFESCELFRISAVEGLAVRFETGPGLWPAYESNSTIFACSHTGQQNVLSGICPAQ